MSNVAALAAAPPPGGGGGAFVSPPPPPQPATSATARRDAQSKSNRLCILGSPNLRLVIVVKVQQINISHLNRFFPYLVTGALRVARLPPPTVMKRWSRIARI